MARDYRSTGAKCPYYHMENAYIITCDGVSDGAYIKNGFLRAEDKKGFRDDFCMSKCWQGCMIAQMLQANRA